MQIVDCPAQPASALADRSAQHPGGVAHHRGGLAHRSFGDPSRLPGDPTTGELAGIAEQAMREAAAVIRNATRVLRTAAGQRRGRLRRAINDLHSIVGRTERVVAQARSRLAGVMPESAHRLVSLHDVDARPIRKGRVGKPVEFGYKPRSWTTPMGSSSTTTSRSETPLTHRNWPRRSNGSPAARDTHRAR